VTFDQRETVLLRDGASVDVVTMRPADAARLVRFHHTLSPDTTYFRFFSFHPELSADELYRFTHVDHRDREAIVVVNEGEIVAVARFDRDVGSTDAEVAFVVADSWQGRGVGTILFDRLARRARRVGIDRFTAQTFRDNARMRAVFHNAGLPMTQRREAEILHVTIDLTRTPDDESS
jgi:RimJ/RimL family protein N-acetyltransferase